MTDSISTYIQPQNSAHFLWTPGAFNLLYDTLNIFIYVWVEKAAGIARCMTHAETICFRFVIKGKPRSRSNCKKAIKVNK